MNPHILVVVEHTDLRAMVVDVLRFYEFETLEASSIGEAYVAIADRRPSLVIADADLPGADELSATLRGHGIPACVLVDDRIEVSTSTFHFVSKMSMRGIMRVATLYCVPSESVLN